MGRTHADYNLHNYVEDNNLTFDQQGFNEIDGAVLTQIANMDLGSSGIDLYSGNQKTFAELWQGMKATDSPENKIYKSMSHENQRLIEALGNSSRYQDMSVSNFVKDPAKAGIDGFPSVGKDQYMEQFAAVTISYEQNGKTYNYVSYRATDNTCDGWAEDLAMLYSMNTQAQSDSAAYMNIIAGMKDGYITGGGHSKGGGDFEYAYLFCDEKVRDRIVKGYVYDSPGLSEEVLARTQYYKDYVRITNGSFICPQDAIVGQVLHEADNATFVHSVESGFNQHDPYSWEIDRATSTFVPDEQTWLSKYINDALDEAVANMSQTDKESFFKFVSYLLYNNGGEGLTGLGDLFVANWKNEDGSFNWGKLEEILDVLSADWNNMTLEEKDAFMNSLGTVVSALASTAYDHGKEAVVTWVNESLSAIKQKFQDAWKVAAEWLSEKKDALKDFLTNAYSSVVSGFNQIASWIRNYSAGGRYSSENPQIVVDTYKLRSYAQRLEAVNRRLSNVDGQMNSLYGRAGLLDLWNLMQADILTGYSWRLLRCASYLNETASDFDTVETDLTNNL